MPPGTSTATAVIIPVKSFRRAKERLATHLDPVERHRLAIRLASGVVDAIGSHPVFIACDDAEVADWAEEHGARVLWGAGLGLNRAVDTAVAAVATLGFDRTLICHADLARPDGLPDLIEADRRDVPGTGTHDVVIVPDRRRDGTNAIIRPTSSAMVAAYGPGSFERHLAAARRYGGRVTVRIDHLVALDIDTWDDVAHPLVRPVVSRLLDRVPVTARAGRHTSPNGTVAGTENEDRRRTRVAR